MQVRNDECETLSAGTILALKGRQNMVQRRTETWRPPLLEVQNGLRARVLAAMRRWFDLQFGSIWSDMTLVLVGARGRVLDVGCGAQPFRRLLGQEVEYIGIDKASAKVDFGYEVPGTVYFSGANWPAADGSIDLVLSTETLEHVIDPLQFLGEAHRCLRPTGCLVVTVPFAARWHFIPYDFWRFTPSCLNHLLTSAGFDEIAIYARGNAVTVAAYKVMALLLPLLFPRDRSALRRLWWRTIGLATTPLLMFCAAIGNLSLHGSGGDDCLGYTIIARKACSGSVSPFASDKTS